MDEAIMGLLDGEIRAELEDLGHLAIGTNERTLAIDELAKLCRLKTDEAKITQEANQRLCEENFERASLKDQALDRRMYLSTPKSARKSKTESRHRDELINGRKGYNYRTQRKPPT